MDEPLAEKIMAAVADRLSNLSGVRTTPTANGWQYAQVPTVGRSVPPPEEFRNVAVPALYVVPGRGSQLERASGRPTPYWHRLRVNIHGLIEETRDPDTQEIITLADTWRWRLREDVLAVLHEDPTLGGLVKMLDFSDRAEDVDLGELMPRVWFVQPVTALALSQLASP